VLSRQATGFDARSRAADESIRSRHPRRTAVTIIGDIVPCVYREARRSAVEFSHCDKSGRERMQYGGS